MELLIGFGMGIAALSWMWVLVLIILFLVNVVLCHTEEFGWSTFLTLLGICVIAWLGGNVNIFTWTWANLAGILKLFAGYLIIGALWSVVKWYFYLLDIRDKVKEGRWWYVNDATKSKNVRPSESYARYNKSRICGWIGHWPFSMIGSLIGDVLARIVKNIYQMLSNLYDKIGKQIFAGFDEEK